MRALKNIVSVALLILLAGSAWAAAGWSLSDVPANGFVDGRAGVRTQDDPGEDQASLGEARLQLENHHDFSGVSTEVRLDFLLDAVAPSQAIDWRRGRGWFDPREVSIAGSPASFVDLKVGRQILTWGTGDMLFINDLFPKDWESLLIGRDQEYLKAPCDSLLARFFTDIANLDLVYTPIFESDRYINGDRLSFYDIKLDVEGNKTHQIPVDSPPITVADGEVAARLYREVAGYELAGYAYRGRWKSPSGISQKTGNAIFPRLNVFGASGRGAVGPGIGNLEAGYYNSCDDNTNDYGLIANSQMRGLVGYSQEVARDVSLGGQYYLEHMLNYDDYMKHVRPGRPSQPENLHIFTLRLTWLMLNQNLILNVMTFISPWELDYYFRPDVTYKATDHWSIFAGLNLLGGQNNYTFFGQFDKNSNVYAGSRYSF